MAATPMCGICLWLVSESEVSVPISGFYTLLGYVVIVTTLLHDMWFLHRFMIHNLSEKGHRAVEDTLEVLRALVNAAHSADEDRSTDDACVTLLDSVRSVLTGYDCSGEVTRLLKSGWSPTAFRQANKFLKRKL